MDITDFPASTARFISVCISWLGHHICVSSYIVRVEIPLAFTWITMHGVYSFFIKLVDLETENGHERYVLCNSFYL